MNRAPNTPPAGEPPHDAWARELKLEDLTRHDIWSLRADFMARLWPDVRKLRVLEVGSGPAHDSLTLARRGAGITAMDYSVGGLRLAQRFYREQGLPIQTVAADARRLPFADHQFDVAYNAGVLEHFEDQQLEAVLDEMVRVVKVGGHVLAFCPNRLNFFYQTHLKRVRQHNYAFERAFTASEMRYRMTARGLPKVHLDGVHVHPAPNYLLPAWLPKHHRIEPACRKSFVWLERTDRMHRFKSLIGQDFVVWAQVPEKLGPRTSIANMGGGPAVRAA